MEKIQFGGLAVVAALFGAVIGSWLKIAEATMGVLQNLQLSFSYQKGATVSLLVVLPPLALDAGLAPIA